MSLRLAGRKVFKGDVEKKIATAGIVSTEFCREVYRMYKPEYIQSEYVRTVLSWVLDYYERYHHAPGKQIQDIFNSEKEELGEENKDIVASFLSRISEEYEQQGSFNYQYVLDQAQEYFRKQSLYLLFERGLGLIASGKVDIAENQVVNYGKISNIVGNWVDPLDPKRVKEVLSREKESLLSLPGRAGELIGDLERTWFVSFMGPMKRGKSYWLQEIAIQALFSGLKVLFVSLEMSLEMMEERIYRRIAGIPSHKNRILFPILDCLENQDGSCKRKNRISDSNILTKDGDVLDSFDSGVSHTVCAVCRNEKYFKPSVWWIQSDEFDVSKSKKLIEEKISRFTKVFKRKMRLVSYPAFTASVDDLERELDNLEYMEGVVPDVIVVDYADILSPSSRGLSERGVIDDIWKNLKKLAAIKHCVVFTASQSNRSSISKKNLSEVDTAEDIRKIAHVDVMIGINQTPQEKIKGICRLGLVAHRHKFFNQEKQVLVFQQLEVGHPLLDSEWSWSFSDFKSSRRKEKDI